MSPKALKTLDDASAFVLAQIGTGATAEDIIVGMTEKFGAKRASNSGTNTLRCGGVTASCTWSKDAGLLKAWRKNAILRLMQEKTA